MTGAVPGGLVRDGIFEVVSAKVLEKMNDVELGAFQAGGDFLKQPALSFGIFDDDAVVRTVRAS
jgi:hypothetical protein